MSRYSNLFNPTPQSSPLPSSVSSAPQSRNSAGGFVFTLDKWKRLERFLILGSDSNTYYQSAPTLTKENASCVTECWTENPSQTSLTISDISHSGRAPKNSPAIFALALGLIHPNAEVRTIASHAVPYICRTSTHLFEFVDTCRKLGKGFGPTIKRAVADWYNNKTDDNLAYQLVKYRQRESYTHERLIRLSHPKSVTITTPARSAMYDWLRGRGINSEETPRIIKAHDWLSTLQVGPDEKLSFGMTALEAMLPLIKEHNLPWEALPTWANTKKEVWEVMLEKMPLNAMIRNLGNMTRLGVFSNSANQEFAIGKLMDENAIRNARLHPFNILFALKTYESGRGFRGSNSWTPNMPIKIALESAFYQSFRHVQPTGKSFLLAMDISPSMNSPLMNSSLSARDASSAMAMATLNSEDNCHVIAFSSLLAHNYRSGKYGGSVIDISGRVKKGKSLSEITSYTKDLPYRGTDCALPMLYAIEEGKKVDCFVVYTDSETWAGQVHPVEALRRYRKVSGIADAKLVVVGMTSTGFTIADPNDPGMLDVVGFDTSAPAAISSFLSDNSNALHESHIRAITGQQQQDEKEEEF